jgi:hypothetical protein
MCSTRGTRACQNDKMIKSHRPIDEAIVASEICMIPTASIIIIIIIIFQSIFSQQAKLKTTRLRLIESN